MSEIDQDDDKKPLRRSTRATRGSIKPVVDLTENSNSSEQDAKSTTRKSKSKPNKKEKDKVAEEEEVVNISDDDKKDDDEDDDDSVKVLDLSDDEKDEDFEVSKPKRGSKATKQTTVSKKQPANKDTKASRKSTAKKATTEPSGSTKQAPRAVKTSAKAKGKAVKEEAEQDEKDDYIDTSYDLSEKEMKEINNAFDLNCSTDGDELLESDDLKTAIRSLGFEPRADEIQKLLKKFSNKDGKVNRANFHKIMSFKMGTSLGLKDGGTNDEITRVFNLLDLDKTGLISLENLRSIAQDLNEEITDEELHEMITEADMDGDQMINKQEFYHIMKKTSLY